MTKCPLVPASQMWGFAGKSKKCLNVLTVGGTDNNNNNSTTKKIISMLTDKDLFASWSLIYKALNFNQKIVSISASWTLNSSYTEYMGTAAWQRIKKSAFCSMVGCMLQNGNQRLCWVQREVKTISVHTTFHHVYWAKPFSSLSVCPGV